MNQFSSPETSLSQRVARGGFWVFALKIIDKGIVLMRIIILARLLAPNDFGLMGIAFLTMSFLESFSQTGFQTALIQKKDDIKSYLDCAWTVLVLRGFILFLLLYLIAPWAAILFKATEAEYIIQVIGISVLFQAVTNLGVVYFHKDLQFNKLFIYQLSGTLADFLVAVSAALIFRSVWALVFGLLAGNAVRCFVSYVIHPYRPHFSLDLKKAKELLSFGKWIFGSSILVFFITQGDDIFVGKLFGITALGFYQLAYKISSIPTTEITHVISQVTFPAYSKMQDNLPRLMEAYLRVLQLTAFLSFPIAGLIFILAPDMTYIFLGEKWMPMVPVMQVLVLWGLTRSIGTATGQVFVSIGRPEIVTKLQFVVVILLVILIYPLSIKWGIVGTSLAVFFSTLVPNLAAFFILIKTIECRIFNFSKMIVLPLINTGVLILLILLLKTHWINLGMTELLLFIILSAISYFFMAYLFDKFLNYRFFDNIQSLKGRVI